MTPINLANESARPVLGNSTVVGVSLQSSRFLECLLLSKSASLIVMIFFVATSHTSIFTGTSLQSSRLRECLVLSKSFSSIMMISFEVRSQTLIGFFSGGATVKVFSQSAEVLSPAEVFTTTFAVYVPG